MLYVGFNDIKMIEYVKMRQALITIFLAYLRIAAKIQLAKIGPKHIIGITGSAGKSSCREAVYAVLKDKFRVKQSSSGNSETGLPLDILGFTDEHNYSTLFWLKILLLTPLVLLFNWQKYDIYVAEMGIDSDKEPKNMSYLLKIIKPNISVFLNVGSVHSEYFSNSETKSGSLNAVAREKGKLINHLPASGWAILNFDDPFVAKFSQNTKATVISFGQKNATIEPFLVESKNYLFPDALGYTFAAAAAVGQVFGLNVEACQKLLSNNFILPPGRSSFFRGINNSKLIDSSYNSSLLPTIDALKLLRSQPKSIATRRIAVLGDMRELGSLAQEDHEKLADEAVKSAEYIFTFGPLMEKYFFPKIKKSLKPGKIKSFLKMTELIEFMKQFIQPGDLILVKGSQNTILLETLVEQLLADPMDAEKLCRRGKFWDAKRAQLISN